MVMIPSIGSTSGKVIRQKIFHDVAPSTLAASIRSPGMAISTA